MSSLKKLLLLIFVLASSWHGMAQVKSLEYLDVQDFRVHKADLQEVTVIVNLRFYNPNWYGMTLKDGDMDAYFNNVYLGKAIADEKTKVPAKDTFLIPVSITARLDKVFSNALDLLMNNTILVKLDGSIKAGKAGIFIRVPIKYEGEQQLNL